MKKRILCVLLLSVLFACSAVLYGCGETVAVESISLSKSTLALSLGAVETETLSVTVTPENATERAVTWSIENSSQEGVITVSAGVVTAKKVGTATVKATTVIGGKTATCVVTVTDSAMPQKAATGIAVKTAGKTDYVEGQSFDPSGTVITIDYDDESSEDVPAANFAAKKLTYSPAGALAATDEEIVFTYNSDSGITAALPVTVAARELTAVAITNGPDKTFYFEGEDFDPAGIVITLTYNDGVYTSTVTEDYEAAGIAFSLGENLSENDDNEKPLTATFDGIESEEWDGTIAVEVKTLTSVVISGNPSKTEYVEGQNFDPAGIQVGLIYNDTRSEIFTLSFAQNGITFSLGDNLTIADHGKSFTATFDGMESEEWDGTITVIEKQVIGISVAGTVETSYIEGTAFTAPTDAVVTLHYNDGDTQDVGLNDFAGSDITYGNIVPDYADGNDAVIMFTYDESGANLTATLSITVTEKQVTGIEIVSQGTLEASYAESAVFTAPSDLTVKLIYNNGTESDPIAADELAENNITYDGSVPAFVDGISEVIVFTYNNNPAVTATLPITVTQEPIV